jgi:hypothetical protein
MNTKFSWAFNFLNDLTMYDKELKFFCFHEIQFFLSTRQKIDTSFMETETMNFHE